MKWLAVVAAIVAVAALSALAVSLIGDTRSPIAWIEPFTLPADAAEPTPVGFADRLVHETRTLAARARELDEFSGAKAPALRFERAQGASASRTLRRLLGAADADIVGEVTRTPEHADILVRDVVRRITVRSRTPRDDAAIDRLAKIGAEDVLLVTSPVEVATLVLADPRNLADAARLDEVAGMIAHHPGLANDPRAMLLRGARAAAHDACDKALLPLERVIAAQPQAPRAYLFAADCLARLGKRDEAVERLVAGAERAKESASALSLAGDVHRRVGQPEQALQLLVAAHGRDASLPQNAIAIGQTLLALHRPVESLAWLASHPVDEAWRPRWAGVLGLAQVRAGQGPAAAATAASLRARDPASLEAIRIEAELAAATKAWPQALGRFNALRLLAPSDGEARAGEGFTLLGLRRPGDAIAAFKGCIDVAPWLAQCRLGLGIALREADDAEAALEPLAQAAKLDALDPRVPAEIARTLRALLRRDEATPYAEQAAVLSQRLEQRLSLP